MPFYFNSKGESIWYDGPERTAPTQVGDCHSQNRNLQARITGTIASTARALELGLPEEELSEAIAKNAQGLGMAPNELRERAENHLEQERGNKRGVERE